MTQPEPNKGNKPRRREQIRLAARLDKNLLSYAAAASVAGVGVLALSQPAEAHIIATPVNIPINSNVGVIQFDINHDGIPDFGLSLYRSDAVRFPPEGGYGEWLTVVPAQAGNAIWGEWKTSLRTSCAAAAPGGARIGDARPFQSRNLLMVERVGSITRGNFSICAWAGNHPPYLGLKFLISGEVHYGWARVITNYSSTVLTGFGYETIPNKAIVAGATKSTDDSDSEAGPVASTTQPVKAASLGTLAVGAQGLEAWRKQDEEESF